MGFLVGTTSGINNDTGSLPVVPFMDILLSTVPPLAAMLVGQLTQAQGVIQDLRSKLRHVHQERETAIGAAQTAMAAKDIAERNTRTAEAALATERATRVRTEGMLRDAEATIRDLREKLAIANRNLHGVQAELAAEHQTRPTADDAPQPAMPASENIASPTRDTAVRSVWRPVGRPRKTDMAQPVQTPITPPKRPQALGNAVAKTGGKTTQKNRQRADDNEEPIQWWVDGWKGR